MVVVVGVLNTQPQSVNRGSRRQPIQAILGFHLDEGSASLLVSADVRFPDRRRLPATLHPPCRWLP